MLSARPSSPPRDPLHCPRPATRAIIIFTSVNIITTITFIYYYHYFNFILWWCAPMRPSSPPSPGCPAPAAAAPAAPWLARETAPFHRRPRNRAFSPRAAKPPSSRRLRGAPSAATRPPPWRPVCHWGERRNAKEMLRRSRGNACTLFCAASRVALGRRLV